jgi:excisionase family DNA binding protein
MACPHGLSTVATATDQVRIASMATPANAIEAPAEILTPDAVAAMFGWSKVTVLRKARAGEIESVKLGYKTIRFRRSDIDRFISEHLRYSDVAAVIERAGDP